MIRVEIMKYTINNFLFTPHSVVPRNHLLDGASEGALTGLCLGTISQLLDQQDQPEEMGLLVWMIL